MVGIDMILAGSLGVNRERPSFKAAFVLY